VNVSATDNERVVVATAEIALTRVREESAAAAHLLILCSFLASDDIPRRLLLRGVDELPLEWREPVRNPSKLIHAVAVLDGYELMRVKGDALTVHRTLQAAVRSGLHASEHERWAIAAGRIVLAAFPEKPEDRRQWPWSGRVLPHALAAVDRLKAQSTDPVLIATLQDRAARYLAAQGQIASANAALEESVALLEGVPSESLLFGSVLNHLAAVQSELGRFTVAKRNVDRALSTHVAAINVPAVGSYPTSSDSAPASKAWEAAGTGLPVHPEIADDLRNLAIIARLRGDLVSAKSYLDEVLNMRLTINGPHDPIIAETLGDLFGLMVDAGDMATATYFLEQAVRIQEATYGPTDDEVVINRNLLSILTESTQPELGRELLARLEAAYGPDHRETAAGCIFLATLLRQLEQFDEARSLLRRALTIDRETYGSDHYRVASDLTSLMTVEALAGDLRQAEARLREAIEIIRSAESIEGATIVRLSGLGDALSEIAVHDHARSMVMRSLAMVEEALGPNAPATGAVRQNAVIARMRAGDVLLSAGRREEAELEYREGLHLASLTTETTLDDGSLYARLGVLAARVEDHSAALGHFRMSLEAFAAGGLSSPVWALVRECSSLLGVTGRSDTAEEALNLLVDEAKEGGQMKRFRAAIEAAVPEGWFAKESTTLLAEDGQANVIASSEPLDPSITTEVYAEVQGDLLVKEFPGYEQTSFETVSILGGRQGYLRHFKWDPPDGLPITQMQLYYVEKARGYTATATTPSEAFPERELMLRQVLRGLLIVD
jgi:tetratricopeptide (TPR) repeat protein